MAAGTIRLDPGSTKNDEGRVVYLAPELTELLTAQVERVQTLSRELERVVPWLFRTSRSRMTITVHETRAVFDRYHIVNPADLQDRLGSWQPVSAAIPVTAGQETPLRQRRSHAQ